MASGVDISGFMRDFRRLRKIGIPTAIVKGFGYTAQEARNQVRSRTNQECKLHSSYIPDSILSLPDPNRSNQVRAAVRGLTGKYADFTAAVFVRGADIFGQRPQQPEKDLGFMTLHEEGGQKKSVDGGLIAVPAKGIQGYSFKTGRGRVKKAWKPSTLLKQYNMYGPPAKGRKKRKKRSTKGQAFLMKSKSGRQMIVRRKTRKRYPLEVLYMFYPSTHINKVWGFISTVNATVRRSLYANVERQIQKVR